MGNLLQELEVQIDDMLGCSRLCPGCSLSVSERKTTKANMSKITLESIYEKIQGYFNDSNSSVEQPLKKFNLIYGSGDHGLLSGKYILDLYERGAGLIIDHQIANNKNSVAMTFSLLQQNKILLPIFDSIQQGVAKTEIFGTVPFNPIILFDLNWLVKKNFSHDYLENLKSIIGTFNKVDLSVNLSHQSIEEIKPKELFLFAKDHGFDEVIINLFPTFDNFQETTLNNKKMLRWLLDYDDLLHKFHTPHTSFRSSLRSNLQNTLQQQRIQKEIQNKTPNKLSITLASNRTKNEINSNLDSLDLNQYLDEVYPVAIKHNILIDHHGEIFQKFSAIGSIAHHPKVGLPSIGNVLKKQTLNEILNKAEKKTKNTILKEMKYPSCQQCVFQKACCTTGFHIFNHVIYEQIQKKHLKLNSTKIGCVHVAHDLFSHYKTQILDEWKKLETE